jgi:very-short-patch-repair endonuclease
MAPKATDERRRRGGRSGRPVAGARVVERRKRGIYNTTAMEDRRGELRKSLTAAEAVLWKSLQRRQLLGKKFRRQASIGRFIVDFYCPECRLVVELDGAPHFAPLRIEYDAERTEYLSQRGIRVIRFENRVVYENLDAVLETIRQNLSTPGTTTPSAP